MKYRTNTLQHIAIIMDGNGRWANLQNKARKEGHKAGAKNVDTITQACIHLGIPYLTLYAFSTENWKRPKIEVDFLMKLFEQYLEKEKQRYIENEVCFQYIGDISMFHKKLQDKLLKLKELTKDFTRLTQILAINYGSHDEISRSVLKILKTQDISIYQDKATLQQAIAQNLDTASFPDVDILIRTGGEQRLSNFLLWQLSYSELFFTQTLWPDFSSQELEKIIQEYHIRVRKFGGI